MWTVLINEKIDQASYFLNKIEEQYEVPSPEIKYFFSAFLSSIESVPDYLLSEANRKFKLGLKDERYWRPSDFCKKSKDLNHEQALKFYRFWNPYTKNLRQSKSGKLFKLLRNLDIHKSSQKPSFMFMVSIKNNPNYSRTVLVEETRNAEIKNNPYPKHIDDAKKEVLQDANRDGTKKYDETDLILKICFILPSEEELELKNLCVEILDEMKIFYTESQKILNL